MLTQETKRHIDAARQVLVGVVPNPASQIDQITNALIYKFMDDMDQAAIKAGGDPSFFIGDLENYAWTKLMDARMGNQERMNLYGEALVKFSEAKQLPPLFREIFKSAFLPYRSPEVLGLFLKEIAYFDYSHSEELGNAYEYLLSIMSSQGDAGQFRTPRHIIDFMVEVVNPTKDDKILDPACGTAGFLISAYKHILAQHDGKNPDGTPNNEKKLTPDERRVLVNNFEGYDVDPGMVRISQVNMYLHQFMNPKIFGYNSLTDEERWADKFDVILANPPFMSPKGGVSTHNKFSVQSNRAEVLFVDYIMNHLRPKGRAAIIVPEGIIFQSGTAYKQLRKNLIEDGLWAVISLPSGVFQPYSGVKTSILLLDGTIAKQVDHILFVKVERDGFDLGAQRRPNGMSDLPMASEALREYKQFIYGGGRPDSTGWPGIAAVDGNPRCNFVSKKEICSVGDYSLSVERYQNAQISKHEKWPVIELGKVIRLNFGERITKSNKQGTIYPVYGGGGESFRTDEYNREDEYVVARFALSEHCVRFVESKFWLMDSGGTFSINPEYQDKFNKDFIGKILLSRQKDIYMCARGGAQKNLNNDQFYELTIPFPPLDIQKEVVEQIEVKQNAIRAAKEVIQNLERERRNFDPSTRAVREGWPIVKLGEITKIGDGNHSSNYPKSSEMVDSGIPFIRGMNLLDEKVCDQDMKFITQEKHLQLKKGHLRTGDVLFTNRGEIGKLAIIDEKYNNANLNSQIAWIRADETKVLSKYLLLALGGASLRKQIRNTKQGATLQQFTIKQLTSFELPLPPLEIQREYVEQHSKEERVKVCNQELITLMEKKIAEIISGIWAISITIVAR